METLKKASPKLVALDFETCLASGEASPDFYRPDFRIASTAVTWESGSLFLEGEDTARELLTYLQNNNVQVVVHNLSFEYGVVLNRFPEISINWHADTARLSQLWDSGGDRSEESDDDDEDAPPRKSNSGLGLEVCAARVLPPEYHDHKKPYHDLLITEFKVKKSEVGSSLHLLPKPELEKYNIRDTEVTYALYTTLNDRFEKIGYNWSLDHDIYRMSCMLVSRSRTAGVLVDQSISREHLKNLNDEYLKMEADFRERFLTQIQEIENETLEATLALLKTDKGREKARIRLQEQPEKWQFNINSVAQKQRLFCDKLGIKAKVFTEKGGPSFKKSALGQWGDGGQMLKKRGSLKIATKQCETLLEKSSLDGRWHIDLMAAGTNTGRMKGAGGLNVQGMSRREPRLMKNVVADPGKIFVSIDLNSGEPTITTHFSNDKYYRLATFDMVGKEPYYDKTGVLVIDDIYLMGMSVSPMGSSRIKEVFESVKFDGLSFQEQWIKDSSVVKDYLKKERAFHKILILGLGYSMGPAHMVESAQNAGYDLDISDAIEFFKAYWELFSGVKRLGKNLEYEFAQAGHLVNPFGYRIVPGADYKCLNYFIQSSVSGLINVLCYKFFSIAPEAQFVTIIHDEIIIQIPEDKEEEVKSKFNKALDSLNQDLDWSVKIRTGWAKGKNLYEAK